MEIMIWMLQQFQVINYATLIKGQYMMVWDDTIDTDETRSADNEMDDLLLIGCEKKFF